MLKSPYKLAGSTLVLVVALVMPAGASAAKPKPTAVSVQGAALSVVAGGGTANNIVAAQLGDGSFEVSDTVALVVGAGCVVASEKAVCQPDGVDSVSVVTGERNDSVVVGPMARVVNVDVGGGDDAVQAFNDAALVVGGGGDDMIMTGDGDDTLDAQGGTDILTSGNGNDVLLGGSGKNDYLDGGPGADSISGGGGSGDQVDYWFRMNDVFVDLDAQRGDDGEAGEGDSVGLDVEEVIGGYGNDTLIGNHFDNLIDGGVSGDDMLVGDRGDDTIKGWTGNDTLNGGVGRDELIGYEGDDTVLAVDNARDDIDCGLDLDVASVDAGKDRLLGCETIN